MKNNNMEDTKIVWIVMEQGWSRVHGVFTSEEEAMKCYNAGNYRDITECEIQAKYDKNLEEWV